MSQNQYEISAPAWHAARTIMRNFNLDMKGTIQPTEKNLAILIDVCTQVFRVQGALDQMATTVRALHKEDLKHQLQMLREAVEAVDMAGRRMPGYRVSPRVTIAEREKIEFAISSKEREARRELARKVAGARTVDEQQKILQAAGLVRLARR